MTFELARQHLINALRHAGLPERYILQTQVPDQEYPSGVAAYLYPVSGQMTRDGSRVRADQDPTVRRLWKGSGSLRLTLFARDQAELAQLLQGILEFLYDNTMTHPNGQPLEFPSGPVGVSYVDNEGILVSQNAVILDFPFELAIFREHGWVPIEIQIEAEIEGGADGE